ncbi:MAG: hypothetical protein VB032_06005, partial [Burkholderiaceae bacterium]|nr:hypothetical protein [Burkholderiaceae bacterium]
VQIIGRTAGSAAFDIFDLVIYVVMLVEQFLEMRVILAQLGNQISVFRKHTTSLAGVHQMGQRALSVYPNHSRGASEWSKNDFPLKS